MVLAIDIFSITVQCIQYTHASKLFQCQNINKKEYTSSPYRNNSRDSVSFTPTYTATTSQPFWVHKSARYTSHFIATHSQVQGETQRARFCLLIGSCRDIHSSHQEMISILVQLHRPRLFLTLAPSRLSLSSRPVIKEREIE